MNVMTALAMSCLWQQRSTVLNEEPPVMTFVQSLEDKDFFLRNVETKIKNDRLASRRPDHTHR
jgi:hypothetical protein